MYPYQPRLIRKHLLRLFDSFSVVVISGARQVGKSRLLKELFPKLPHITFDPVMDIENAKSDPDLFLRNRKPPVILDEIQYAPTLVPAIKRIVDKDKRAGQFLITGSQQWEVMKNLAESLAGRAVFLDLESFALKEIYQTTETPNWLEKWFQRPSLETARTFHPPKNRRSLYEQLWRGFLPEAHFLTLENIPDFLNAYQRTYIERDVRQMADIDNLETFSRFFRLCGALTAQEVNHSELGRDIGITPQTAGRWLALLKATFQWFELPSYFGSAIKRISKKPKGYLSDTGLICSTQIITSPESIGSHPLWGALFETSVINEVRKLSRSLNFLPAMYHWRSHSGAEVDLLLECDGKFYPVEVKASSHPGKKDGAGIQAFRETYPNLKIQPGLIIAPTDQTYPIFEDIFVIPWDSA